MVALSVSGSWGPSRDTQACARAPGRALEPRSQHIWPPGPNSAQRLFFCPACQLRMGFLNGHLQPIWG